MSDGRIYSMKEVHCHDCGEWRGGLGRYAATELKEAGWRQVRGKGWVCPNCAPPDATRLVARTKP